jgi:hypothetical protein
VCNPGNRLDHALATKMRFNAIRPVRDHVE